MSDTVVRAFDGSRKDVVGEITLIIEVAPSIFETIFQVMDVDAAYTMLLGRPWIHHAQAVPSTLHQCVKFIEGGRIITVKGEEQLLISKPVAIPYIDCAEEILEASFHGLEMEEKKKEEGGVNNVVTRMMKRQGYEEGRGLGAHLQGGSRPLELSSNGKKWGLGFEVSPTDKKTSRNKGSLKQAPAFVRSHLSQLDEEIAAIEEEAGNGVEALIWKTRPKDLLHNWESEPVEDVWRLK